MTCVVSPKKASNDLVWRGDEEAHPEQEARGSHTTDGIRLLDFSACQEPNPLSLKQPAAWPSLYSIADLWLARLELSWWVSSSFGLCGSAGFCFVVQSGKQS